MLKRNMGRISEYMKDFKKRIKDTALGQLLMPQEDEELTGAEAMELAGVQDVQETLSYRNTSNGYRDAQRPAREAQPYTSRTENVRKGKKEEREFGE